MGKQPLFIDSHIDDYGLDPYEFRLLCRIARRGNCKESMANIAAGCQMSRTKATAARDVLAAAGLIEYDGGKGKRAHMRITPPSRWMPPDQIEAIRKAVKEGKSCSPGEQVSCSPDGQLGDEVVHDVNNSCSPGEQPNTKDIPLKKGNTSNPDGESEMQEDLPADSPPPDDDGFSDSEKERARSLFEHWRRSFPSTALSHSEALAFFESPIEADNPRHVKAFSLALERWRYGVNAMGWNPCNIPGILDRARKLLEADVPIKKMLRQPAPTSEPNHKPDPNGEAKKAREQHALAVYDQMDEDSRKEIRAIAEERARVHMSRLSPAMAERALPGSILLEIANIVNQNYLTTDGTLINHHQKSEAHQKRRAANH